MQFNHSFSFTYVAMLAAAISNTPFSFSFMFGLKVGIKVFIFLSNVGKYEIHYIFYLSYHSFSLIVIHKFNLFNNLIYIF